MLPTTLKILMLEDLPTDADLIARQLSRDKLQCEIKRVDDREGFVNTLQSFSPDIILSDHALPQFNSLDALEVRRKMAPQIPFILVTGSVSEEFAVTCIKAGANDYILKTNLARLASSIKANLDKTKLQTEYNIIKSLNEEIEKKNQELNYLNQEKDRFVGIVSHDLQNHVSSMMFTLGKMNKNARKIDEKQRSYVKKLNRSAINMYKLLNDFLIVNRIHNGIIQPVYTLVNFGGFIAETVEGYEDIAARKRIKISYRNKCKNAFFRTDMSYLGIIADNLISNAIKYTPKDGKVTIIASKTQNKYRLEVTDNGPGIPPSDIPKLYGRFQKLTPKPTAGEPTNGLGLSIVKDLVDALKATIECKTEVDKGTSFIISF